MTDTCCLTTKDFSTLEAMLQRRRAFADPIAAMLEEKLSQSRVLPVDAVSPDIVTLNSRVVFRIDAGPLETRTLVQNETRGPVGSTLPLGTRRGLCMLGMARGQTASIEQADGRRERIAIEAVLYQPEAARRALQERPARRPAALTLVYSAPGISRPLGEIGKIRQTEDNDPGPSAA
ncbi:MAG: nucleoside-diphosphate kinase [Mesorhizobium sp.]